MSRPPSSRPSRPTRQRPPGRGPAPSRRASGERRDTSWEKSAAWYDRLIGERGSDLYQQVVLPGALRLLDPRPGEQILDLGCGQGVLARRLAAARAQVTGVDAAPSLIQAARRYRGEGAAVIDFQVRDAADLSGLGPFDAITAVLCLQNMAHLPEVARAAAAILKPGGRMIWVLNHPAFRIPKQTGWGFDEDRKVQYRRVDGYSAPAEIPITMHPGQDGSEQTLSFHRSLADLTAAGFQSGLVLSGLEEWHSHKTSQPGARAKAENRARREFPLFLALRWTRPPQAGQREAG
ncbi:MAG: class I SAM-dependent methyltransferase [Verrucomicrobiales bacterium]|nr:class I SAM-dependent methyltransferase [Verrucomicrobiales bacterium]